MDNYIINLWILLNYGRSFVLGNSFCTLYKLQIKHLYLYYICKYDLSFRKLKLNIKLLRHVYNGIKGKI